jgi:hypothetical protein
MADPKHSDAEEQELQKLYAELKPQAQAEYINYFLSRTPAHLQQDMLDIIKEDFKTPPVVPPPQATTQPKPAAPKK